MRFKVTTFKANEFEKRLKKMNDIFKKSPYGIIALTYTKIKRFNNSDFFITMTYANANFLSDNILFDRFKKDLKTFDKSATIVKC